MVHSTIAFRDQMRWSQNSTNPKIIGHIRLVVLLCQPWKMSKGGHPDVIKRIVFT